MVAPSLGVVRNTSFQQLPVLMFTSRRCPPPSVFAAVVYVNSGIQTGRDGSSHPTPSLARCQSAPVVPRQICSKKDLVRVPSPHDTSIDRYLSMDSTSRRTRRGERGRKAVHVEKESGSTARGRLQRQAILECGHLMASYSLARGKTALNERFSVTALTSSLPL